MIISNCTCYPKATPLKAPSVSSMKWLIKQKHPLNQRIRRPQDYYTAFCPDKNNLTEISKRDKEKKENNKKMQAINISLFFTSSKLHGCSWCWLAPLPLLGHDSCVSLSSFYSHLSSGPVPGRGENGVCSGLAKPRQRCQHSQLPPHKLQPLSRCQHQQVAFHCSPLSPESATGGERAGWRKACVSA